MKKFLSVVLAVTMLFSTMVLSASAAEDIVLPGYTYSEIAEEDLLIQADSMTSGDLNNFKLDFGVTLEAEEDYGTASEGQFADWIVDAELVFSDDVKAVLAGQYDKANGGRWLAWEKIEFNAGEVFPVMEKTGLHEFAKKYEDIVFLVKKFNCGIKFDANTPEGTTVTLSVTLTNPETGDKYVVGDAYTFTYTPAEVELPDFNAEPLPEGMVVEADGLTSSATESYALDFGVVFEAVEDYKTASAAPYAKWIADFELEFSKETTATLLGQYDKANNGKWLSLGSHTFEAGQTVKIMKESTLDQFVKYYEDVVLFVEKFNCGIVLDDAQFGTDITLRLCLTNPETGDFYVLGENVYTYGLIEDGVADEVLADKINDLTEEEISNNVDYIKDVIADLDSDAKKEITTDVIENIIANEIDTDATTPAAYSADKTVEVEVEAGKTSEPALEGATQYDITAYENGMETHEIDMPVLIAIPVKADAQISKVVHVRNDGTEEVITNYYVENGILYYWMSDFSWIGIFYAGEATLKLEKVAEDTFDIVLEGDDVETVKNFVSGEFTVDADGAEFVVKNIADKTIVKKFADGKVLVNVPNFVDGETWSSVITDAKITLGQIVITSRSEGEITLADAVMHKHDGSDSNLEAEITTVIGNAADFDTTFAGADAVAHKLTVKVNFKNKIEYIDAAYNEMTITINGVDYALGSDNADVTKGDTDCSYSVTVEVKEMDAFDIVVAGAGYRTAYYYNTMATEDRIVTFWNNVENVAQVMDVDASLTNVYSMSNINFLAGDIYNDGKIDTTDLAAVVGQFGQDATAEHDLNRDQKIDSKDVAYVLVSWGK